MAEIIGYGSKHNHQFKLTVTERANSTNMEKNTTWVDFKFTLYADSWEWSDWSNHIKYTVTIDGENYTGSIGRYDKKTTLTIMQGSKEILHESNGTRSISCSFSVTDISGANYTCGNANGSNHNIVLSTIPRASGINAFIRVTEYLDTAYGVRFTPLSSSFYYKIRLSIPGVIKITDVFVGGNLPTSEREVNFGFSSADLALIYSKIGGTDVSVIIGAVVETYLDSNYTNKVGESPEAKLVMILPTSVKPIISGVTLKENSGSGVPSSWGVYVQNKSKIDFSISASGIYSSTISSYKMFINGINYLSQNGTTGILLTSGTNTYSVSVTDSRGRSATYNGTFNVVAYTVPKISTFSAVRCTNTGTENDEGAYAKITVAGSISSINSKNTQKYVLQYRKTGTSDYTSYPLTGSNYSISQTISDIIADIDSSYEFVFTITDHFSSTTRKVSLETAFTLLNFNSTGTGLGIGKVSELENTLDVNLASKFRSSLTVDKSLVVNKTDSGTNVAIAAGLDPIDFNDVVAGGNVSKSGLFSVKDSTNNAWYNLINVRHRNGAGDGTNFGMQIRRELTDPLNVIEVRSQHNGTWTNWEEIFRAKTLFYNTSGDAGTIQLSESASRFDFIDIHYRTNDQQLTCGTMRVVSPNGRHATIVASYPNAGGVAYLKLKNYLISDMNISPLNASEIRIEGTGITFSAGDCIYIMHVIGYR